MGAQDATGHQSAGLTNYCSYLDPATQHERIGHLEGDAQIQPLSFASGTPLTNLYEVIEAGEAGIVATGEPFPKSSVKLLAPIQGRDVLCVGKNYAAHATEFNSSGYDSSDKTDQPTHPVIFTKRFTSIIANGDEIYPHPEFTETVDYEGELGVIVGKAGFQISEDDAMDYVWGYTIINDMTARERQRDHKQFYLGKSPDTFCPMGSIAVPKHRLDKVVRVQTRVNGELRQDATTEDLIFTVPYLIKTLSEAQTILPGDVLATGTPAGVGFGQKPPAYLHPGDEVSVSITGLGTLTNRIASGSSQNPVTKQIKNKTTVSGSNNERGRQLSLINGKPINYLRSGAESGTPAVFIHGLGGTMDYWTPLIDATDLKSTHALHLYDFEGHGLSPTSPLSVLSIESLAEGVKGIFDHAQVTCGATLFAHSMGCLIAIQFALKYPSLVSNLILMGPPPAPLPEAGSKGLHARAALVREKGMQAVAESIIQAGTSENTKKTNPMAVTAIRLSLLGQDPEGYAKACTALANATKALDIASIKAKTLTVTGEEDKVSPPARLGEYSEKVSDSGGAGTIKGVGHWHIFEDVKASAEYVSKMI